MQVSAVSQDSVYRDPLVAPLSLVRDVTLPFRVYLLRLQGQRLYVGLVHKNHVAERLRKHCEGAAAHFTSVYKPVGRPVLVLWPAGDKACEAYLYYHVLAAGLAKDPAWVGGWTMSGSKPDPLHRWAALEGSRAVRGECFGCGSRGHGAAECTAARVPFVKYCCTNCGFWSGVLQSGASTLAEPAVEEGESAGPGEGVGPEPDAAGAGPDAAVGGAVVEEDVRPKIICVGGERYTTMKWFLGRKSTPREVIFFREHCLEGALQIRSAKLASSATKAPGVCLCLPVASWNGNGKSLKCSR
jgi:hypothetical protein